MAGRAPDPGLLGKFAFKMWSNKQGKMVSLLLHIGDRLGLFGALAALSYRFCPEVAAARL